MRSEKPLVLRIESLGDGSHVTKDGVGLKPLPNEAGHRAVAQELRPVGERRAVDDMAAELPRSVLVLRCGEVVAVHGRCIVHDLLQDRCLNLVGAPAHRTSGDSLSYRLEQVDLGFLELPVEGRVGACSEGRVSHLRRARFALRLGVELPFRLIKTPLRLEVLRGCQVRPTDDAHLAGNGLHSFQCFGGVVYEVPIDGLIPLRAVRQSVPQSHRGLSAYAELLAVSRPQLVHPV